MITSTVRHSRLEAFQDWRYGIFLHWGPIAGYGKARNLTREAHDQIAAKFEAGATAFDATQWIANVKRCGARYLTLVPKHGFDFCLWPTTVDTPHTDRDFVTEVADACRMKALPLFLYLNLNAAGFTELAAGGFVDWPQAMQAHHQVLRQWLTEYCTRYQPAGIWFDAWPVSRFACEKAGLDPHQVFNFAALVEPIRAADPTILILNKEITSPEIDILTSEYLFRDHFGASLDDAPRPVETCDTLPGSAWFATREVDEPFLTARDIEKQASLYLKRLITSAGRGINYLLDAGPLPNGAWQTVEMALLQYMGAWLERHGAAIFDTRPVAAPPWGYMVASGRHTFLHVIDNRDIPHALDATEGGRPMPETTMRCGMPENRRLPLTPWMTPPRTARTYPQNEPVPIITQGGICWLDCSQITVDPIDTVIRVET